MLVHAKSIAFLNPQAVVDAEVQLPSTCVSGCGSWGGWRRPKEARNPNHTPHASSPTPPAASLRPLLGRRIGGAKSSFRGPRRIFGLRAMLVRLLEAPPLKSFLGFNGVGLDVSIEFGEFGWINGDVTWKLTRKEGVSSFAFIVH